MSLFSFYLLFIVFNFCCRIPDELDSDSEVVIMTLHSEFVGDFSEILPGVVVSFKYSGNYGGAGKPMNPKIYGVRKDVKNWRDLVGFPKRVIPESRMLYCARICLCTGPA